MRSQFLIVDGNNLTLRAMHGSPPLYDKEGYPTGCLMTSIRTLCKLGFLLRPYRVIWVWDSGHSPYRKSLYPEYKVRDPIDPDSEENQRHEEWKTQVEMLELYLPLLGVAQIRIPGTEGDDLIYNIQKILDASEFTSVIASSDADFYQMIGLRCLVYNLSKEKLFDWSDVEKQYGVGPHRWVDYKAMVGDSSDKIKGIEGIGAKRAASILAEHKCLYEFYRVADEEWLKKNTQQYYRALVDGKEIIERNKKLMDLSRLPPSEVPLDVLQEKLEEGLNLTPDLETFAEICKSHQLETVLAEKLYWKELYAP